MIGLPSLRTLDSGRGPRIWLAVGAVDMRWGFDRLAETVRTVVGQDPFGEALFLFRSRRNDRMKCLWWDRDGFVCWYNYLDSHYTSFLSYLQVLIIFPTRLLFPSRNGIPAAAVFDR
jgi:transposase